MTKILNNVKAFHEARSGQLPDLGLCAGAPQRSPNTSMRRRTLSRTQPHVPRAIWRALVVLLAVSTGMGMGCAAVEKDRRAVGLQAATNGYQSALRWGYYDTAFGYVHPDQRRNQSLPEVFADLRVTGYDVAQPPVILDDDSANQVVVIDYLYEDTQIVKRLTDRQQWRWDDQIGTWWLHSGIPAFATGSGKTGSP